MEKNSSEDREVNLIRQPGQNLVKQLSVKDLGVSLGYGLFETLRVYDGIPFLVEDHLDRLLQSCRELSYFKIPSRETLLELITTYIREKRLHSRALRLSISFGCEADGIEPHVFITDRAILYEPADYKRGIEVAVSSYRKNEFSPIVRHKTFNQLENFLSLKHCQQGDLKECLFLNTSGFLAEGSKSNLFFVRDGAVFTPAPDCGILPGITRQIIIQLLKRQGIKVEEGYYTAATLYECDEAFCSNSLMEILPLVKIGEKNIGRGIPGQYSRLALSLYRDFLANTVAGSKRLQI